jgi:hypothetical protein
MGAGGLQQDCHAAFTSGGREAAGRRPDRERETAKGRPDARTEDGRPEPGRGRPGISVVPDWYQEGGTISVWP